MCSSINANYNFSEETETWVEKTEGGCKGLKTARVESELPENEEILRDFFIGGCYVIKDFKNNLKVRHQRGLLIVVYYSQIICCEGDFLSSKN